MCQASCADLSLFTVSSILIQTPRAGRAHPLLGAEDVHLSGGEEAGEISVFLEHQLSLWVMSLSFYPDNQVLERWLGKSLRCPLVLRSGH